MWLLDHTIVLYCTLQSTYTTLSSVWGLISDSTHWMKKSFSFNYDMIFCHTMWRMKQYFCFPLLLQHSHITREANIVMCCTFSSLWHDEYQHINLHILAETVKIPSQLKEKLIKSHRSEIILISLKSNDKIRCLDKTVFLQPFGGLFGVISEDNICSCSLEAHQALHDRRLLI